MRMRRKKGRLGHHLKTGWTAIRVENFAIEVWSVFRLGRISVVLRIEAGFLLYGGDPSLVRWFVRRQHPY